MRRRVEFPLEIGQWEWGVRRPDGRVHLLPEDEARETASTYEAHGWKLVRRVIRPWEDA